MTPYRPSIGACRHAGLCREGLCSILWSGLPKQTKPVNQEIPISSFADKTFTAPAQIRNFCIIAHIDHG
ncbi:MAG: hypothetical protein WBC15_12885, partial [Mycobacterium sp.]